MVKDMEFVIFGLRLSRESKGMPGERFHEQVVFILNKETKKMRKLPRYPRTKSPTGFNWGYKGEGPTLLAFSIARYYLKKALRKEDIPKVFHKFAQMLLIKKIISFGDIWKIEDTELDELLAEILEDEKNGN